MKTKEILLGPRGGDATDGPSLLPQQACALITFTDGQQRQRLLPQHGGLSVNTKGADGEEGRRGMGSGSQDHSLWVPESKWHMLLL